MSMNLCGFTIGLDQPLFLIAGPCVIESLQLQIDTAGTLKEITARLGINFIFKSSFDKANRTSGTSFRGPGIEEGLKVLDAVKRQLGVPVLTDVHEYTPMDEVASVVDVLQTPAFLCRQTDFIQNVARAGKPVNIKKGQFLSPWEMKNVVGQGASTTGNPEQIMVCERGFSLRLQQPGGRTCAVWPRCATPAVRWCSTRPTRCSCRAAPRATPAVVSASTSRCWRAPPSARRRRRHLHGDAPQARRGAVRRAELPGRWARWRRCWRRWSNSTCIGKRNGFLETQA